MLLEDHVNRALSIAREIVRETPLWEDAQWRLAVELAVALHDFGKATRYFQEALHKRRGKDRLSCHALLSALFFLNRALAIYASAPAHYLLFPFLAIKHHHTDLYNVYQELVPLSEQEKQVLHEQIQGIDASAVNQFLHALDLPEPVKQHLIYDGRQFAAWLENDVDKIFSSLRQWWRKNVHTRDIACFYRFLALFSSLLEADKVEAALKGKGPERQPLQASLVAAYKQKTLEAKAAIDALREKAYKEVLSQCYSPEQHFYTITLPTGLGKTLTGLAAALRLREVITHTKLRTPRLIYALPFLSIIDQNAAVLENVLRTQFNDVGSDLLLKHHHLAEFRYRTSTAPESEEFDFLTSRLLIEGWHSEIVITTFVQLFNTILPWQNTTARRLLKLAGSIVLLDEVQALPTVFWPIVKELFLCLAEEMDTYFMLITATQPYLVPQAQELVPDPKYYFAALDRYTVFYNATEPTPLPDFVEQVKLEPNKRYLFVANTIAAAQQLFDLLRERTGKDGIFLASSVVPKERQQRIRILKARHYPFAVSTQLVEAGVDIDADIIYRDFAPLDALIQTAGRCNRHAVSDRHGSIHILSWCDKKERTPFASYIYDPVLLRFTKEILKTQTSYSERDFTALLEEYFRQVWERGIPDQVANDLREAIMNFRFADPEQRPCIASAREAQGASISQFCLIPDEPYRADVFVELDDEARKTREQVKECLRRAHMSGNVREAWEELAWLKPKFYQYVVSVPLKGCRLEWDEELNIHVVPQEKLGEFYHPLKGFVGN